MVVSTTYFGSLEKTAGNHDFKWTDSNCRIHHVTVPIATRILIANVRQIGLSNVCVINLVYFKMQV